MQTTFISLAVILLLIAFWAWMFNHMLNNDDIPGFEPLNGLHWPPAARNQWLFYFIVLSIFTAGYYYFTVYRKS